MNIDPATEASYAEFVTRQSDKVDRTAALQRFRFRRRWWTITLVVATVAIALLIVVGELT
ncbi:MAG: hypothetical protein Q4G46_13705 [Propionibacteriaceae bacterium]|nr:hypothetical protein [Propionibacteriaceae bacterium]